MMRHKNKIRRFLGQCQPAKKLQKPFTRYRVETGTRFIENQNSIPRHQGPTDQDALPFSLGKECLRPIGEIGALHLTQVLARFTEQSSFRRVPQV